MSGSSTYWQDKKLNFIKGTGAGQAPVAVYIGLFNGDPTDAGSGGTEVTTTIRAAGRVAVTFGSISTASGTSSISNNADVDYGSAAAGATMTHFGLFDAVSAGNLFYSAALTGGTQSVSTGTNVKFSTGSLTVSEA